MYAKLDVRFSNKNILNYYADTNEMETEYFIKDPHLMENDNAYAKYVPVGFCRYLQYNYKFFKNTIWPDLTDINFPKVN